MKRISVLILAAAACLTAQETREPRAVEVAHRLMEAMGGQDAWNNTRYIRFDFKVGQPDALPAGRSHLWDKWEGRYRLEQEQDGKSQVVLFNVNTKQGDFYVDGAKVEGDEATEAIEKAYGAFINDTYWLAMPWKWLDPGVNLRFIKTTEHNGEACDVVQLSFEAVGLTPGDRYLGFVSMKSGLMVHWEYTLQSDRTGAWDWEYLKTGGIQLARTHVNGEGLHIDMGTVSASESVDEQLFSDPANKL